MERPPIMINTKVLAWSLGVFGAVIFITCVLYGLIAPESLHMGRALGVLLPGFTWLTLSGLLIGLVEAFLYGAYAGLVFAPIHNALARRWGGVGLPAENQ
jgi:hypothetical protein